MVWCLLNSAAVSAFRRVTHQRPRRRRRRRVYFGDRSYFEEFRNNPENNGSTKSLLNGPTQYNIVSVMTSLTVAVAGRDAVKRYIAFVSSVVRDPDINYRLDANGI